MNKPENYIVTEYFECDCHSSEHTLRFTYLSEDIGANNQISNIYLNIFLDNEPWYKRILIGLKYIFGYKSKYGHFGEWIFYRKDAQRLKKLIEKIEQDDAKEREKL